MNGLIRPATPSDAASILAIYSPYVRDTAVSFEEEVPTLAQIESRIERTLQRWPWLVCEQAGEVVGYVYASQHRDRAAYRWAVDVAAYVSPTYRRAGIGRALYTSLFELLGQQGYYRAYAGITLPNPASVALHEAVGFGPVGVYKAVGYKLGAWHDVGWWQKVLPAPSPTPDEPPAEPRPFPLVQAEPGFSQALHAGLPLLNL